MVLKVEHINPFIRATRETFSTMVKTEARPGKVALRTGREAHADISGIIGLSGGAKGSVALGFPRISALKIVSAFVGEKTVTLDETAVDAIGELANIISGSARRDLSEHRINISLPTVVLGERHELTSTREVVPMVVPFETALGPFLLTVNFKSES
jgi:chemotaxis protein CheX